MTTIPPRPLACDCRTPIWRFLNGTQWPPLKGHSQWVCLNCPLHAAIQDRDDVRRAELLALIDATREKARTR